MKTLITTLTAVLILLSCQKELSYNLGTGTNDTLVLDNQVVFNGTKTMPNRRWITSEDHHFMSDSFYVPVDGSLINFPVSIVNSSGTVDSGKLLIDGILFDTVPVPATLAYGLYGFAFEGSLPLTAGHHVFKLIGNITGTDSTNVWFTVDNAVVFNGMSGVPVPTTGLPISKQRWFGQP